MTVQLQSWAGAERVAGEMLAAADWRVKLAAAVREVAQASFVAVVTHPPDQYLAAQAGTSPPEMHHLTDQIFVRFVPHIHGFRGPQRDSHWSRIVVPLECAPPGKFVRRMVNEVLAPNGIQSLLRAFLTQQDGATLGSIYVGLPLRSCQALSLLAAPLGRVCEVAEGTLRQAIGLAEGCGVRVGRPQDALASLSERELQIVNLVMLGLSNANVAARLSLAESTVGSHLKKIFPRMGVHSRVELAARFGAEGRVSLVIRAADLGANVLHPSGPPPK